MFPIIFDVQPGIGSTNDSSLNNFFDFIWNLKVVKELSIILIIVDDVISVNDCHLGNIHEVLGQSSSLTNADIMKGGTDLDSFQVLDQD
jgi:hypothetical protein